MAHEIIPLEHQLPLPQDELIHKGKPDDEAVPMDVVFVGGGPAGLAGAIELARLVKKGNEGAGSEGGLGEVEIAVLEKGAELGHHTLSGSVINPCSLRELFPELEDKDFPFRQKVTKEAVYVLTSGSAIRIPTPPTMHNQDNYTASICELVKWLGEKAEGLGVNLFSGFPAGGLLVEGDRVTGVRTTPAGLDRERQPGSNFEPAMDLTAKVVALCEGPRGMLTQAWFSWQGIQAENPQIYALGVKENWTVKKPLDRVIHTLGWPLPRDCFGGSFMYPLADDLVSIGLVAGLDYRHTDLDVHALLQQMKGHKLFLPYLEGGELNEWGAKTIPEGGYYALAERRSGDGLVVLGDSAGFVDVPSLKGIHYAIQSGIYAARAIYEALKAGDTSAAKLAAYDRMVDGSYIAKDLKRTRNMRLAFKSGFYTGGFKASLMTVTGGRFPGGRIDCIEDAAEPKVFREAQEFKPDGKLTFSKVDAVFKSGNATRDTVPQHVLVGDNVPEQVAKLYKAMCPAEVYDVQDGKLIVNVPNCIDCKATDVLGPRWTPREGGSGPRYRQM